MIRFTMPLCAALIISGCATNYKAPTDDSSLANIILEKGYEDGVGLGKASLAYYGVQINNNCNMDKQAGLARMTWTSSKETTKTIKAGEPIKLLANITKFQSSGGGYGYLAGVDTTIPCLSRVTFTPRSGATYRASFVEKATNVCEMTLVEEDTGKTPEDAKIEQTVFCWNDQLMDSMRDIPK